MFLQSVRVFAVALLALATAAGAPLSAQPGSARQIVAGLHDVLLKGMNEDSVKERYALFEEALSNRFDLRLMAAVASGSHWNKANGEARDRLAEAFKRFSIGTYTSRFSSFSGESFEIVGTRDGPRGTAIVDTRINRRSEGPVSLSYVLREFPDGWRIVDILLDGGISELAVKRSEYRSVLSNRGMEGLAKLLDERTDALVGETGR